MFASWSNRPPFVYDASAAFGDVGASLFVVGAGLGAACGDFGVSLFVAGAAFGGILGDSWTAKIWVWQLIPL